MIGEWITCAAIWYKDYVPERVVGVPLPVNCNKGIVICGHRHPHCIHTFGTITGLRTVQFGERAVGEYIQGFLTSKNRFVGREEAAKIAFEFGQIQSEKKELYSEDLY